MCVALEARARISASEKCNVGLAGLYYRQHAEIPTWFQTTSEAAVHGVGLLPGVFAVEAEPTIWCCLLRAGGEHVHS